MKKPTANEFQDLGLGTRTTGQGERMVNPDGTFNVERRGLSYFEEKGIYHWLISMPWSRFVLLLVGGYILLNLVFALLYVVVGLDNLDGMRASSSMGKFWEAFFFSAQTFTTVGYGRVNPVGFSANIIASIESMGGLMAFALATGILYGRFSRPSAKILFSDNAIVAPYRDGTGLMFRIANQRSNQLIEVEVTVTLSYVDENDRSKRLFRGLDLERRSINFFPTTWTVVHPITEDSPLYFFTPEDFINKETEILILLKAFDDTFSQIVYSRSSYRGEDIVVGAKFNIIFGQNNKGVTTVDLHRINEFAMVNLPEKILTPGNGDSGK
jgi:inward rectifier potassium channel